MTASASQMLGGANVCEPQDIKRLPFSKYYNGHRYDPLCVHHYVLAVMTASASQMLDGRKINLFIHHIMDV